MSATELNNLINEFPNDAEAIVRLDHFLTEKHNQPNAQTLAFGLSRIYEISQPSSQTALIGILTRLVSLGVLKEIYRVESDIGGGIEDFPDFLNIPAVIYDHIKGNNVEVDLNNVRLLYKFNA